MAANPFELQTSPTTSNKGLINSAGTFTQDQGGTSFAAIQPGTNSTVSGQVNTLLNSNSPYIQSARTRARQEANSRGLINSSIAAGAGELAAINSALPIAQQDASTFFNAQQGNQTAANNFISQKNTFDFQGGEAALDRNQALTLQGNQFAFQGTQAGLDRTQQKDILSQQQTFQGTQAGLDREQQTALQNNQYAFQGTQAGLDRAQQLNVLGQQQDFGREQAGLDRGQQLTVLDRQQGFAGTQAGLDRAQQTQLTQAEIAAASDRQAQQIAANKDLAQLDTEARKDLFNLQIGSEKDILTLRATLDREAQAFAAELQDEANLLNITRGRNVSLQQYELQIANQYLNNVSQILADKEMAGPLKEAAIAQMRNEFESIRTLAADLASIPVLESGQGGL